MSVFEAILVPGTHREALLAYEVVPAAPFRHLGGGQGGFGAPFFDPWRLLGGPGGAQGRPREARRGQEFPKGAQMVPKAMPEANFVEMSETLKSDDSTTFLMVFSGPEGCLEPPKARKKRAETALRSKYGKKPTSGTKKAPKVAAEPSPERPRNGKRRPGSRPGGAKPLRSGAEALPECCRSDCPLGF
jgi:hypothetical protein